MLKARSVTCNSKEKKTSRYCDDIDAVTIVDVLKEYMRKKTFITGCNFVTNFFLFMLKTASNIMACTLYLVTR